MPIRPELLVRGADGTPFPPPELVAKIQARSPGTSLRYRNAAWDIIQTWRENDPRWSRVQSQEISAEYAFDFCGSLPLTCGLDEAPGYIERELRNWSPEQFAELRESVRRWNETGRLDAMENVVLGAISDDIDKSNIITPGISAAFPANPVNDVQARTTRAERRRAEKEQRKVG